MAQKATERHIPYGVFEERKRELQKSKRAWRNWFLFSIVLLVFITCIAFLSLASIGFTTVLWLEFAVSVPIIYSAIFFHAQHNREREFLEEYSFKAVVARSMESYRVLLKQDINHRHPEEQKKFLDFIIKSAEELHMPPRAIISSHPIKNEEDVKMGVIENVSEILKRVIPKV